MFLAVPEGVYPVVAGRVLEVMPRPCADDESGCLAPAAASAILELASRADAVAIGPGLGRSPGTRGLVESLLEQLELPVVLDADGLWAVAGNLDWVFGRDAPTVLTPHAGELGRLLGRESSRVNARRLHAVSGGADDTGATVLLKGADTLVAAPGHGVLVADLGNPGLATAGSGDVLTGIVAAFLAKGMEPRLAAAAAAAAQGEAAQAAAERRGFAGMIASDVLGELSRILSGNRLNGLSSCPLSCVTTAATKGVEGMNLAMLGGFGKRPFAPGWTKQTAIAVLGGGEIDLTQSPPGEGAQLTAVAVLGGIDVTVAPGSRLTVSGFSLLGGREIKVEPGEGPAMRMRLIAVLGGVEVKEGPRVS